MLVFVIEVVVFEGHDFKAMVIFFCPVWQRRFSLRPRNTPPEACVGNTARSRQARQLGKLPHFRLRAARKGDASQSTGER